LDCGLEVLAGHAATAIAGHQFNADRNFALLTYALAPETAIDIDFCQISGGSNFSKVKLNLRLCQLFMKAKCIYCRLVGLLLHRATVWKLPPGFCLPGAANGTDDHFDLVGTDNHLCFFQGALSAEPFISWQAAPVTDGLHHILTI
jgi:hypothetical protein